MELESSTLFEVPKENHLNANNNSSLVKNVPSTLLDRTINNNTEDANYILIKGNKGETINRIHDLLESNVSPSTSVRPLGEVDSDGILHRTTGAEHSRSHNIAFQGVPKYYPVNVDILGLRRSPIIATLKRKQLDLTLNHVEFARANKASQEDVGPLKEYHTLK